MPGIPEVTIYPWFAITTRPNLEKVTTAALQGKGFEAFLPVYRTQRRWSDRTKQLEVPLFPGYTFCKFDTNRRAPILSTPGATSIVGFGATPGIIEEEEIQTIRTIIDSGIAAQPWPYIKIGHRILIEKGPLAGVEGIVEEINKKTYRLIASITLLQRSVKVEIDQAWARTVSYPRKSA